MSLLRSGLGLLIAFVPLLGHLAGADDEKGPDFLPGVTIVYSANILGEIEPCGCRSNPTGGVHRRLNWQNQVLSGETLSVDSGDLLFATVPIPPLLKDQWEVQAKNLVKSYNTLKVEVMTPGELDLADGLDFFEKLRKSSDVKMVSANLYKKGSDELYFAPYVVLKKGGKRVGIFGLIDEGLPLPSGLEARDHLEAARKMVRELKDKADVIFALSHLGVDKDQELAKDVPGIQAIFGAHTQSYLMSPLRVGDTLIFQPSLRGQHIGTYIAGENTLHSMDMRYDSLDGHPNALDKLLKENRAEIAEINKKAEADAASPDRSSPAATSYQTFIQCSSCHAAQFEFHKTKPHFSAYQTLVQKHQNANLDCLKCHTVGMGDPSGFSHVGKLVLDADGKALNAVDFEKTLPAKKAAHFGKATKAFLNVQCENCHGAGGEHPFGASSLHKTVSTSVCLSCHTIDQAPAWYKDGKPNTALIAEKLKSMTCPRDRK